MKTTRKKVKGVRAWIKAEPVKTDPITKRLQDLKHAAMRSDPHDNDEQLNIVLDLIDCIQDIQREGNKP